MQRISLLFFLLITGITGFSQSAGKAPEIDKSPLDISYYPANYPILKIQNKVSDPPLARIIYSRPQRQGRKVFGELVEYGKVWRLGANEATELELYKDAKIGGKKISKGRYTLYALVNRDEWSIILNKDTDTWGAFKYDQTKDILRTTVPVEKIEDAVDTMSMWFEKTNSGISLVIEWEQAKVTLPIIL